MTKTDSPTDTAAATTTAEPLATMADQEAGAASAGADVPAQATPTVETPRVLDEAAWAEAHDDGEDEDDAPLHFGAVAEGVSDDEADGDDDADEGDADVAAAVAARPDLELTMAEQPEIPVHLIDEDALWVVKRLRAKGFEAYLTGGFVRDLLLGRTPKDFDVATVAHPNQVRAVFRNCRLVGRRFRLAHVFFPSGKVIETATFRANPTDTLEDLPEDLLVERDNVFGTVEEDARRRDLTINGLFYDPIGGKVLDFVDGRRDLDARLIRTIGDPDIRFQEDPVRILRAIKFATRLGFGFDDKTWDAMTRHAAGLLRCAPARLQEELLRLLTSTHAAAAWTLCERAGVVQVIMPELVDALTTPLEPRAVEPRAVEPRAVEPRAVEPPSEGVPAGSPPPAATPPPTTEATAVAAPTGTVGASGELAAVSQDAPLADDGSVATTTAQADAVPVVDAGVPTPPAPAPLSPDERKARLAAVLGALDEVRRRDADVTSAALLSALLVPVYEAMASSTTSFDIWFAQTAERWTERLRLTRHDRERIPQLFLAQEDLAAHKRRGHHARGVVVRPSFRESLLLLTVRLWSAGQPLDEVAAWKVVAQHFGAPYQQPRFEKNRMRAAGRHGGGGRDRGRDRDRGRGGGRGRGGRDRGRGRR
jgi:tRNA nucleotidyltransferase/poly(A) polymerase